MTRGKKGRESCNDMTYHDIVPILFIAFSFWIYSTCMYLHMRMQHVHGVASLAA
jgi:hypothetical protein